MPSPIPTTRACLLVLWLPVAELVGGLAQSLALPFRAMPRRPGVWDVVRACLLALLGVVLTVWHLAGNILNTALNVFMVTAGEVGGLFLRGGGGRFYVGRCVCRNGAGPGHVHRRVLVVEGGPWMAFLRWTRVIIAGHPLRGTSVGNVLYTSDVEGYWMEHECGHTEQARILGPLYLPVAAVLMVFSHRFEVWCTHLGLTLEVGDRAEC